MKSQLINLLDQAKEVMFSTDQDELGQSLETGIAQLAGKVIVDKDHLRTLLLAVSSKDSDSNVGVLQSARNLFPGTNTIDILLKQLNEEG